MPLSLQDLLSFCACYSHPEHDFDHAADAQLTLCLLKEAGLNKGKPVTPFTKFQALVVKQRGSLVCLLCSCLASDLLADFLNPLKGTVVKQPDNEQCALLILLFPPSMIQNHNYSSWKDDDKLPACCPDCFTLNICSFLYSNNKVFKKLKTAKAGQISKQSCQDQNLHPVNCQ